MPGCSCIVILPPSLPPSLLPSLPLSLPPSLSPQMITLGGDAELELVDSLDPFSEGNKNCERSDPLVCLTLLAQQAYISARNYSSHRDEHIYLHA